MNPISPTALKEMGFAASACPITHELSPNVVKSCGDFHISYNRNPSSYGSDTTAIVLQQRVFFVLNGNHCEALNAAASAAGVRECMQYFIDHIVQANLLSEHRMATGLDADPFALRPTALELIGQSLLDQIAMTEESRA